MDDEILYRLLDCDVAPPCPLGAPPCAATIDNVEHLVKLDPPRLAPRDFERHQEPDALLTDFGPFPAQSRFRPRRDFTTGAIIDFEQVSINEQSQLSLARPFDAKGAKKITGNVATGVPFLPGGFDAPIVDIDTILPDKTDNVVDWGQLRRDPPQMSGIDFGEDNRTKVIQIDDLITKEMADSAIELNFDQLKHDKIDSVTNVEGNSEVDEIVDVDLMAPVVELMTQSTIGTQRRQKETFMVNADRAIDVSRPWSEIIPDPAYQWPFELDLFQKRAIVCLERHDSVFVAAHTSAGKTVVAEYAIALALRHMTKVIYTSPIKALSNQKFRDFRTTFTDVGLLTGDVQIKPEAGCLIMTTEILRSMLYAGSDVIRDLEWVVFDEVHYINDPERGVVWEEVLIMLPQHVGLILLSATVPNIEHFAQWVGRIKQRKMYVTSTLKRPVPLEHYMFTGVSTKTSNQLFKIVDPSKRFLNDGYKAACEAKRKNLEKSKKPPAEQGIWSSIIDCLKKRNGLPCVAFIFSRKRCDSSSAALLKGGTNLNTEKERAEIELFYHRCIVRLKPVDRKLPQVTKLQELLCRGVGVHHSGILPILKETIELLFARGLVKLLFATETFAMGVNMPARTVVFDSIRKYDEGGMRELRPDEYIQMAGRAGRRGLDATGTVILLQKQSKISEHQVLHQMMLGRSAPLVSKFRLTYGMLLSILRVEYLRVEDMMLRSFVEFGRRGAQTQGDELDEHRAKIERLSGVDERINGSDFVECINCAKFISAKRLSLIQQVVDEGNSKLLHPGRLVQVNACTPGVILKFNGRKYTVLYNVNKDEWHPLRRDVLNGRLCPGSQLLPKIEEMSITSISMIFKDTVQLPMREVNSELQRGFAGAALNTIAQKLLQITQLTPINFVSDGGLKQLEQIDQISHLAVLMAELNEFTAPNMANYEADIGRVVELISLKEELKEKQYTHSEESLQHLPEYHARLRLLKNWNYVRDDGDVQLKGRVACQYRGGNELLLTEMLLSNSLKPLTPAEICALFSSLVFQAKVDDESDLIGQLPETCQKAIETLKVIREDVLAEEAKCNIISTDHDSAAPLCFGLAIVVYKWALGEPFKDIMSCTDVQEGVIVRCIQRLEELCREVRNGARTIGDFNTTSKMEQCSEAIRRDIVFAASLYTQEMHRMIRARKVNPLMMHRLASTVITPAGFNLVKQSEVTDLKLNLVEMEHAQTGAKWVHINKESEVNKVFNICFRTVPMTDNGVAHILEHIVLCGSKQFPVRDPFFKMINRSLNNFMNAMTGTDYTMYPFATTNEKDFDNLLRVYLDAVFQPNLRYLDFLQEAWRLGEGDIEDDANKLVFKGVVFNEMKGAMADRDQIFFRRLIAAAAPSGTYGYNSGGEPMAIPSLTHLELKQFHADHYNPANAQILTYGAVDLENTAERLNAALLSVPAGSPAAKIEPEPRWQVGRRVEFACPWNNSASDPSKQATAALCWTVCDRADAWANFVGGIVGSLLTDGPSSPLYRKLIESGLGSDYATGTGFLAYLKDSLFCAGLCDARVEDLDRIIELVMEGIEEACEEGYEKERIDGLIHQMELSTRNQSAQFGLHLTFSLHAAMLHDADPNESLQIVTFIERLKTELEINPNFLIEQTKKMLIDNNSRVELRMIAQENYEEKEKQAEADLLNKHLTKLSRDEKLECLDIEMDLETEQAKEVDSSCLPTVHVSDIPVAKDYSIPIQTDHHVHYQPTQGSGVTHLRALIELDTLTDDELALLPLYESVLTKIGRGGHDYRQIGVAEDLVSGGYSVRSTMLTDMNVAGSARPAIMMSTYGLDSNLGSILGLFDSLMRPDGPDFNPDRIKTVANEVFTAVNGGIVSSGHTYSMAHAHSYVNDYGQLNERLNGLSAIKSLKDIISADHWDQCAKELQALHAKVCHSYTRYLIHSDSDVTTDLSSLSHLGINNPTPGYPSLVSLPDQRVFGAAWDLGFPVSFVSRAIPTCAALHPDAAALRVLGAMMGSKYLLREVRESGGAYGAGSQQADGAFRFFSYRDPAGLKTLSKYTDAIEWMMEQKGWGENDVNEAILKVFQGVDAPKSPSTRGVGAWRSGLTANEQAEARARLLSIEKSDLLRVTETYLTEPPVRADCIIGPMENLIYENNNDPDSYQSFVRQYTKQPKWKTFTLMSVEYAPGNNGAVVSELRDFVTATEHDFNAKLSNMRQKKTDYAELIRKHKNLEDANFEKMKKLEQKCAQLEATLAQYAHLDSITAEIDTLTDEQKKELNVAATYAFKIKFMENLCGFITKFDGAIGCYEAVFMAPNGPIYYSGSSEADFERVFKEAISQRQNGSL